MQAIIFQQGSGSRIFSTYLTGEVWPEPFCVEPAPSKEDVELILKTTPNLRLAYNHLEEQPWLYDLLKDYKIIHLYRDPGRTFTRKMAKYGGTYTRQDLVNHIEFVRNMRAKVNSSFNKVIITEYEDFIRDLYHGEVREFLHL